MLDLEAAMLAQVCVPADRAAGRVRLVAPESLCAYRLPPLLVALLTRAPEVHLALAPAGTALALAAVRNSTTEAALLLKPELIHPLCSWNPSAPNPSPASRLRVVLGDRPRGHVLAWKDLAEHDVLLLEDRCSCSNDVARRLRAAGQPDSAAPASAASKPSSTASPPVWAGASGLP